MNPVSEEIKELLKDPPGDIFVKKVDCLGIQNILEHRLTKLESLNIIEIIATLGSVLGIVALLWKLFS